MTMSSAGVTAHHPLRARRLLSGRVVVGLAVVQALGFGLWLPGLGRNVVTGLAVAFPLAVLWVWRALSRPVTPATTAADSRTSTKVVAGGFAVMMGLTCQVWVIVVAVVAVLAILAAPAVLVVWRRRRPTEGGARSTHPSGLSMSPLTMSISS
jgi:hypothetical protein